MKGEEEDIFITSSTHSKLNFFPTKWINDLQNWLVSSQIRFWCRCLIPAARGHVCFHSAKIWSATQKGSVWNMHSCDEAKLHAWSKGRAQKKKKKNRSRVSDRSSVCTKSRLSRIQRDGWDALRVAGRAPLQPRCLQAHAVASLSRSQTAVFEVFIRHEILKCAYIL